MATFLFRLMNSNKINLANLKPPKELKVVKSVEPEIQDTTITSPYFSPRRTRNKVKIAYTDDAPATKASKRLVPSVSQHFPKVKKETFMKSGIKSYSQKVPMQNIKNEFLDTEIAGNEAGSLLRDIHIQTNNAIKTENIKQELLGDNDLTEGKLESNTANKSEKWEPANWRQMLENMRFMRQGRDAPVDTMGCHKCGDDAADEKTRRFHILIALMLSSQTKDQTTYAAMERLKQHGLTPANLVVSKVDILEKLIYPVSFYKNKTKYIQKAAQILLDQYDSDIPSSLDELIKLPGVGPKMAHICMHSAWNVVTGIGVDTHVHRISNRLRWVRNPTKTPEQTRMALEDWLPFELWYETNELMVGFGQTICSPTYPKCAECINNSICPASTVRK